jgi:hypothetical protein
MRTCLHRSRLLFALALAAGLGSVAFSPQDASAGCTIICETCTINLEQGTAVCTNCRLVDCQPQPD